MFTRAVELRAKPGKTNELCRTASDMVLPILRDQQGFKDEVVLVSNTDANRVLAISFWNSREDAERYQREEFARVNELIKNLCEGAAHVETYDVNTSIAHHINLGKAA